METVVSQQAMNDQPASLTLCFDRGRDLRSRVYLRINNETSVQPAHHKTENNSHYHRTSIRLKKFHCPGTLTALLNTQAMQLEKVLKRFFLIFDTFYYFYYPNVRYINRIDISINSSKSTSKAMNTSFFLAYAYFVQRLEHVLLVSRFYIFNVFHLF